MKRKGGTRKERRDAQVGRGSGGGGGMRGRRAGGANFLILTGTSKMKEKGGIKGRFLLVLKGTGYLLLLRPGRCTHIFSWSFL